MPTPSRAHRSRLSRAVAEIQHARLEIETARAQFSAAATALPFNSPGWNAGALYHAAQPSRHRDFTGDRIGGLFTRVEEQMLRPYDRVMVISRGRIMIRNNPWVACLFLAYVQEIGTPTYKSCATLATTEESKAYNDTRERLFERWATDCESGDDLSLDEVIEIWHYERIIAGEMFVVKLRTGELQLIPSELCGTTMTIWASGGQVPAGTLFADGGAVPAGTIERDGILRLDGRIVGYRFATRDPFTKIPDFSPEKSTVVRADYVLHLYDRDRVEQGRGVPMTAPILVKLQDLFETASARDQQVKNSACLSMWITKNIDPYGFAEAMKGALRGNNVQDAATLKTIAERRSQYQEIRAGAVYYGEAGETLNLIEPKLGASDWHEHYIDLVQVCCAVLDKMPVEVGIEGFRSSNYSSARGTVNIWKRNVVRRRRRTQAQLLDDLHLWQTRRWELFGDLAAIPDDQRRECHWGWPAIPDIDGTKTAAMHALELANGTTTLEMVCAEKGLHADQVTATLARERIDYIEQLADQAVERLHIPRDRAIAYAMATAPRADSPALSAILADAFISPDAKAAGTPAPDDDAADEDPATDPAEDRAEGETDAPPPRRQKSKK